MASIFRAEHRFLPVPIRDWIMSCAIEYVSQLPLRRLIFAKQLSNRFGPIHICGFASAWKFEFNPSTQALVMLSCLDKSRLLRSLLTEFAVVTCR